jgi:hypothetical protein
MGWFSGWWDKVTDFFKTDSGKIIKLSIANLLKLAGPVAIDMLLPVALQQVKLQELQGGLDGAMKADRVRQYLTEYAKQQGIEVGAKVINQLIEHAVMSLAK